MSYYSGNIDRHKINHLSGELNYIKLSVFKPLSFK